MLSFGVGRYDCEWLFDVNVQVVSFKGCTLNTVSFVCESLILRPIAMAELLQPVVDKRTDKVDAAGGVPALQVEVGDVGLKSAETCLLFVARVCRLSCLC